MVRSGLEDHEAIDKLSGNVLGYGWQPNEYLLSVSFKFNISKRRKGKRLKPNLSLDIPQFMSESHNRWSLLSICNGIFDPLGLVTPYTIKLKLLIKELLNLDNPGDWDSPVSEPDAALLGNDFVFFTAFITSFFFISFTNFCS